MRVIVTAGVVCGKGSVKRYGIRPSVCPSMRHSFCGPGGQEILIDCCSSGVQWANAGSATLSAYVVAGRRLAVLVEYIGHDPHKETRASKLQPSPSTLLGGQDSNRSSGYSSAGSIVGIQVAQSSVSTIH